MVESIAKIKVSIYNDNITIPTANSHQHELVLYYTSLHSLYKHKCHCDSDNTLMSIIYIECKHTPAKIIVHFNKQNRISLFNILYPTSQ